MKSLAGWASPLFLQDSKETPSRPFFSSFLVSCGCGSFSFSLVPGPYREITPRPPPPVRRGLTFLPFCPFSFLSHHLKMRRPPFNTQTVGVFLKDGFIRRRGFPRAPLIDCSSLSPAREIFFSCPASIFFTTTYVFSFPYSKGERSSPLLLLRGDLGPFLFFFFS